MSPPGTPILVLSPADIKLLQGIREGAASWKQSDAEGSLLDRLIASGASAPAAQPGTVNLTKLIEAREKMTPGEYQVTNRQTHLSDANAAWHTIDQAPPGVESIVQTMANQAPQSIVNAAGLVATHNAASTLIEVARAAKVVSDQGGMRGSKAAYALRRALAKVSL